MPNTLFFLRYALNVDMLTVFDTMEVVVFGHNAKVAFLWELVICKKLFTHQLIQLVTGFIGISNQYSAFVTFLLNCVYVILN